MAVNIHITIIELNALHTKRQNLFQELDAVIHLLMRSEERFSRNAETDLVCRLLLEKKNRSTLQVAVAQKAATQAPANRTGSIIAPLPNAALPNVAHPNVGHPNVGLGAAILRQG